MSAASTRSATHLPGTEIFDGVGHLPYEEVPETFNSSVIEFLATGDIRPPI
jgi:pimeloyl-ACP methyl ester carboxylesterase